MKSFLVGLAVFMFGTPVQAELMGMLPGRGANVHSQSALSVEAGASWYSDQLKWSSFRVNFKFSSGVLGYFDYAQLRTASLPTNGSTSTEFSGAGFGGGFVFVVPSLFAGYDVAFKGAYHASVIDEAGADFVLDNTVSVVAGELEGTLNTYDNAQQSQPYAATLKPQQWSAEFVISPIKPLYENGTAWYATLGYASTSAWATTRIPNLESTTNTRYQQKDGIAFGVGLIKPVDRGQVYAGFAWLSGDPLVGVGYRYAFK